jgi:hypothetical protein
MKGYRANDDDDDDTSSVTCLYASSQGLAPK